MAPEKFGILKQLRTQYYLKFKNANDAAFNRPGGQNDLNLRVECGIIRCLIRVRAGVLREVSMAATGKSTKLNTRKKSAPRKNEQEMMGRQVAGLIVIGVGILALYLLLSGQGGASREALLGT